MKTLRERGELFFQKRVGIGFYNEKIHFAKKHEFTETDGVYVHRVMGDQDGYN